MPVIQAVTITFVLIYVVLNLIVDISYGYLNPRVTRVDERRSEIFGQGPFAGDTDPSPQLVEDAGHRARRGASSRRRTASPWRRACKRLLRDKPAVVALAFLLLIILVAVFASLVAPHDPDAIASATPFATPSLDHPLGTDHIGRDTFSRVVYGAQVSLRSGFQIVGVALLIAVPLGSARRASAAAGPT